MEFDCVNNEKEYLLYIELPNLVNRIMTLASGPHSCDEFIDLTEKQINKVIGYQLMKSKETALLLKHVSDNVCDN